MEKHIWGVPSGDFPGEYDLELTYDEQKECYHLSIETIYCFEDDEHEFLFFRYLLCEFENWMMDNGHYITGDVSLNDLLYHNARDFKRVEEAFYWFNFMVRAYGNYHGYC